jgi:hypothetical protein
MTRLAAELENACARTAEAEEQANAAELRALDTDKHMQDALSARDAADVGLYKLNSF